MKRVQNILTEKEAQLTTLVNQSEDAVSLIPRLDNSMGQQFDHNAKIIGKFKAFLED